MITGSGSIEELATRVTDFLDLPDAVLNLPHDPEKSSQTEIEYRLARARTYLKKYGIIDNSERGVRVIVPEKRHVETVDPLEVVCQTTIGEMRAWTVPQRAFDKLSLPCHCRVA